MYRYSQGIVISHYSLENMKTKSKEDQQVNFRDDAILYNLSAILGKFKWMHFVD